MNEETGPLTLTEPPADALAGESVPRENDEPQDEQWRSTVERIEAALRARGQVYREMPSNELRERARTIAQRLDGGDA